MTRHLLGSLLLSAALLAPAVVRAEDETHITNKRYYDRDRKDYHQWNRDEDQAYRQYLQENHRQYRDFNRLSRNEQSEYWTWRHQHEDADRRDRDDNQRHDHQ
ncbi:MAG TPA: hypothetical protein VG096_17585 [Bryobacteraceae bacterium]|nr:hypothetical protein [Bryobacteraceae bacterium]